MINFNCPRCHVVSETQVIYDFAESVKYTRQMNAATERSRLEIQDFETVDRANRIIRTFMEAGRKAPKTLSEALELTGVKFNALSNPCSSIYVEYDEKRLFNTRIKLLIASSYYDVSDRSRSIICPICRYRENLGDIK